MVGAAEELDGAVGAPAREIARAVHPRAGLRGERVGHEALGGERRAAEIAARQAVAAEVQLAGDARPARSSPAGVEHVEARVRDRRADRRPAPVVRRRQAHDVHVDRRLGRAVEVVELGAGERSRRTAAAGRRQALRRCRSRGGGSRRPRTPRCSRNARSIDGTKSSVVIRAAR